MDLDELISDKTAQGTCKRLLQHYKDFDSIRPSSTFVTDAVKRGVKESIDELNHAINTLDRLLYKNVFNDIGDITQSFTEVEKYVSLINESHKSIQKLKDNVEEEYTDLINLYLNIESHKDVLDKISKLQTYISISKDILLLLNDIYRDLNEIDVSISGFRRLAYVADLLANALESISHLQEHSNLLMELKTMTDDVKNEILKKVMNGAILPFIHGSVDIDDEVIILSHWIYYKLSLEPSPLEQLVELLINETSDYMHLKEIITSIDWKHSFLSQYISFLATYNKYAKALYRICKLKDEMHKVPNTLSPSTEAHPYTLLTSSEDSISLKSLEATSGGGLQVCDTMRNVRDVKREATTAYHARQFLDISSKPRLHLYRTYMMRCIDLIKTLLAHLYKKGYDVPTISPQLVTLGESTHLDLEFQELKFSVSKYYYRVICDLYVKEFITTATDDIMTLCRSIFKDSKSAIEDTGYSEQMELEKASIVLMNLSLNEDVIHTMSSYLQSSKCSDIIYIQVEMIITCGLKVIFDDAVLVKTDLGTKLKLSDGGSKLILSKPNDCHYLNAKIYTFIQQLIKGIKQLVDVKPGSELERVLMFGEEINLINLWCTDVVDTIWHTVSYITNNNEQFKWTCQHVLTTSQHIIKICTFLKQSYFDELVRVNRHLLLSELTRNIIIAFVSYSSTIWPLSDDEKLSLLNTSTELEFTLTEVLSNPLTKAETDLLSSFRKLIFLELPDIKTIPLSLSKDFLRLHIVVRLLNSSDGERVKPEVPLYKHLGFETIHSMIQSFGTKMSDDQDDQLSTKLEEYLEQIGVDKTLVF